MDFLLGGWETFLLTFRDSSLIAESKKHALFTEHPLNIQRKNRSLGFPMSTHKLFKNARLHLNYTKKKMRVFVGYNNT